MEGCNLTLFFLGLLFVLSVARQDHNDQYLVRFKAITSPQILAERNSNVKILKDFTIGQRSVWLVEGKSPDVASLLTLPLVESFERNFRVDISRPVTTRHYSPAVRAGHVNSQNEGEECKEQDGGEGEDIWGLIRTSAENKPNYEEHTYQWQEDGEGVDIYILDTGVDVENPEFGERARHGMVAEGVQDEGPGDLLGHGTYTASVAAGTTWGAAKHARIVSCKVMGSTGSGTIADIIEGVMWVADTVHKQKEEEVTPRAIISLSLSSSSYSQALYGALQDVSHLGVAIIAAAGNGGSDARETFPAGHNHSIAVGASDRDDNVASFSNHGCKVSLYAPGVAIPGAWSASTSTCEGIGSADCVMTLSGTSSSAPLTAGILARWLSGLNNDKMEEVMRQPTTYQEILTSTAVRNRLTFPDDDVRESSTNRLLHKTCGQKEWNPTEAYGPCQTYLTTTGTTKTTVTSTTTRPVISTTTPLYTTLHPVDSSGILHCLYFTPFKNKQR